MWDIRMPKMLKQIRFENEQIGCIKFIKQNYLIAAHNGSITLMNQRDNFNTKQTFQLQTDSDSNISTIDSTAYQNVMQMKAMAFSERDRKLYVTGSDNKIHVWNINFAL